MNDPDWTGVVDALLARIGGSVSAESLAAELGVSAGTVRRWRRLREAGEPIPEPRGDSRAALLLTRDGRNRPPSSQVEATGATDRAGETWPDYLTEVLVREARAAEKRADAALIWARRMEKEADGWAGAKPQPALTSSEEAAAKEEEAKREEERRRNQAQPSAG